MKILYTTFAILIGFFSFQANIQSVRAEVTSDVTITFITTMTGGPLSVTDISHFIIDSDGTNIPYTGSNSPQIFNLHSGHIAFKIHPLDGYDVTLDNCNTDEEVPADTVKTCTISYVYNGTNDNGFDDIVGTTNTEVSTSTNTGNVTNGDDDVAGSNNSNATSTNTGGTSNGDDDTNQSTTTNPVSTTTPETNPQPTVFYGSGGSSGSSSGGRSLSSILPVLTDLSKCSYLTDYLNFNSNNDSEQVVKLQTFLKNYENLDVTVNGIFDQKTLDAVKSFQSKYLNEIMTPWGETAPSGYVFYTTQKKINEIYCKATFSLTPAQLAAIEKYRKDIEQGNTNAVLDEGSSTSTTTPVEVGTNNIQSPENLGDTQSASAIGAFAKFWSAIWDFFKNIFSAIF